MAEYRPIPIGLEYFKRLGTQYFKKTAMTKRKREMQKKTQGKLYQSKRSLATCCNKIDDNAKTPEKSGIFCI